MNTYLQYALSILSGLIAVIPLVVKLVQTVEKYVKEKNWRKLMQIVLELMETAEGMFEKGADKKEWVLAEISTTANTLNYDMDMDEISAWIDTLCDMSRVVNAPTGKAG